jgi:protein-tyrosine phosphatase
MTEILPRLFLGSAQDAASLDFISNNSITHVLNVAREVPKCAHVKNYAHIPADDSWYQDLIQYFPWANKYISESLENGGNILVHCAAGISRSATIVIAYIMTDYNMSMSDAYNYVKSRRAIVSPNLHFVGQLVQHEKEKIA